MRDRKLMVVDSVGAVVLTSMVCAVGWYAFMKPDTATSRVHTLLTEVHQLRADFERLQSVLDDQKVKYRALSEGAEAVGRLPSKSPIDENLKRISALARENDIKVVEVIPASQVQYPDVLELQYRITAEGQFTDHVRFLRAFEACRFWADVTHLRLFQVPSQGPDAGDARRSELTVSFYSAMQ